VHLLVEQIVQIVWNLLFDGKAELTALGQSEAVRVKMVVFTVRVMIAMACFAFCVGAAQASPFKIYNGMKNKPAVKHTRPMDYSAPPASFLGQHFTNGYGCTYSRTQAPGYPVVWFLQVNSRANGCPNEVPGN
jgi:hypothetical protein